MVRKTNEIVFNTAIITYPSDYDGMLPLTNIISHYETQLNIKNTKVVIAQEDPDKDIQRIHYHLYYDSEKRKSVTTKYFDIPLAEPVYVFIKRDTTREYKLKDTLDSELGIDNTVDMHAKLANYIDNLNNEEKENEDKQIIKWDLLSVAHPNIQLKKEYGDKYCMLRYVVKQKLLTHSNFDIQEELRYLETNKEDLKNKAYDLTTMYLLKELNLDCVDELIELCKKYAKKLKNKRRRIDNRNKRKERECDKFAVTEWEFTQKIRELLINNEGITKNEVMQIIKENEDYWHVYTSKYVNYSKLICDLFKNQPTAKPKRNYEHKFYLPKKLYDYCLWLDKWVENWMTGKTELLEHRPLGLVLIGNSRTCKTSLMSLFGDFSYFKNVWNLDNWEGLPPYTIMDDMDAGDEGKGLSFCWYKPFFGAQDCMTVTDKYRPKEDIVNGKPLIWINNFDITETFKSEVAQDYIRKNMIYVNIGNVPLSEPHPDWIEGHNDYYEFDPKTTWYYKNIVNKPKTNNKNKKDKGKAPIREPLQEIDLNSESVSSVSSSDPIEELEPLSERKRRIDKENEYEIEKGRPTSRIRRESEVVESS